MRNVLFEGEPVRHLTNVYHRDEIEIGCQIQGPAIIEEMDSTTILPPYWEAYVDELGNIRAAYREVKGNE
ncbi:hypothetical protein D3C87_1933090 [compost metagenome]